MSSCYYDITIIIIILLYQFLLGIAKFGHYQTKEIQHKSLFKIPNSVVQQLVLNNH